MSDALYNGMRFRVRNIIDESFREALDIVIDTLLPAARLVRTLEQFKAERGLPKIIRMNNGSQMTVFAFTQWCEENGIMICYIEPGKPSQNAYVERYNRIVRYDWLTHHLFNNL